jgi:hypothetical protein
MLALPSMAMHSKQALISDSLHDFHGELRYLMDMEVSNLAHIASISMVHALIAVVRHCLLLLIRLFLFLLLFVIFLSSSLSSKTSSYFRLFGLTFLLLKSLLLLDFDL